MFNWEDEEPEDWDVEHELKMIEAVDMLQQHFNPTRKEGVVFSLMIFPEVSEESPVDIAMYASNGAREYVLPIMRKFIDDVETEEEHEVPSEEDIH